MNERELSQALAAGLVGTSLYRWGWTSLEIDNAPPSLPLVTLVRIAANVDAMADMCLDDADLVGDITVETHVWHAIYEQARILQDAVRAIVLPTGWRLLSEQDAYDGVFRAWRIAAQWSNVGPLAVGEAVPPEPDVTPPTVAMTSPADGATVSGTVVLAASASDPAVGVGVRSVVGVRFLLDGVAFGAEDFTAPYAVSLDTTALANGAHTLSARARDAAGNTTTSAAINVTVDNAVADTTPPVVSVTAPADGATVTGDVSVTATATDNVAVIGVQFLLDGANLGVEDTTPPYAITWDSTAATDGAHTLSARARDAASNTTTSAAVDVTVDNGAAEPLVESLVFENVIGNAQLLTDFDARFAYPTGGGSLGSAGRQMIGRSGTGNPPGLASNYAGGDMLAYLDLPFTADHYAEALVGSSGGIMGAAVRVSPTGGGVAAIWNGSTLYINRYTTANVFSSGESVSGITGTAGLLLIRMEAEGDSLRVFADGVEVFNDADFLAAHASGLPGLAAFGDTRDAGEIQTAEFGDLVAFEGFAALFIPLHLYVPPEPPPPVRAFSSGFDEGFA